MRDKLENRLKMLNENLERIDIEIDRVKKYLRSLKEQRMMIVGSIQTLHSLLAEGGESNEDKLQDSGDKE